MKNTSSHKKHENIMTQISRVSSQGILKEFRYPINEGTGPSGQDWEALIAVAVTNPTDPKKLPEWGTAKKYWGNTSIKTQAMKLAKTFESAFGISQISQMGSSRAPLSSNWKQWGGTNNTPKTDLISGEYHISLKKVGGSQLISGLAGEMKATFNAAKQLMGGDENLSNATIKWIDKLGEKMIRLSYHGYVEELDKLEADAKAGKVKLSNQQKQWIEEKNVAQIQNKILTDEITKFFQDVEFRNAFCFEAVTGNSKFASREPVANQLVEFNPETGTLTKSIPVKDIGDVAVIANSTKFYFSFKTSAHQASVALRSAAKSHKSENTIPTFSSIIKEEYQKLDSSIKRLVEGLNEGSKEPLNEFSILDKVKKVADYAGDKLPKIKNSVVNFFMNIAEKIESAITSIKQFGKKMLDKLFEFFGIDVELKNVEGDVTDWAFSV